jgi:pSer/pThr/pTyr-binding forkhead associated (FHA) protein
VGPGVLPYDRPGLQMDSSRSSPHLASPVELKRRIEVERTGDPFFIYRDEGGEQRIVRLGTGVRELTIGRHGECDVRLDWDAQVSGLHAELRRSAGHWLVVDDGLSRNGTFVNGERVLGQRRLRDGDQLELGQTLLIFRRPGRRTQSTALGVDIVRPELSDAQRRVLVALCRPYRDGSAFARPATNQEIADELYLSVAAVKSHLRALFQRFAVEGLPRNEKRIRLVQRALDSGAVSPNELEAV